MTTARSHRKRRKQSLKNKRLPRSERKVQMLRAAASLFGRQGFAATSMDDIATACGITKPMLYAYFGSKEGLYEAMVAQAGQRLVALILEGQDDTDVRARLRHAINAFLNFVDQYRDSWRMVFSGGRQGAGVDREIAGYRQLIIDATVRALAELCPEALPEERARRLAEPFAHALLGSSEAIAIWWVSTPGTTMEDARRVAEQMALATAEVAGQALQAGINTSS